MIISPRFSQQLADAITAGGAELVDDITVADAMMWTDWAHGFPALPENIRWVALPMAGIDSFFAAGVIDDTRIWTNASGLFADNVAEHALTLLLTGLRLIPQAVRTKWDKKPIDRGVRHLWDSTVGVIGAGGSGRALVTRLTACGAHVIAVNKSGRPVEGADETIPFSTLKTRWNSFDHVVVLAPLTPDTRHLINAESLTRMRPSAWIVNVARGPLVDHDALLDAVRAGQIAGAALDVTDPEPLPSGHPLWDEPNVIITPHVANPASKLHETFAPYLQENVKRFIAGEPLMATVDPTAGY